MTRIRVPAPQHWGIHGCLVLFDPLGYQLLDILRSDNCVATISLIIFFTLSVFKASSEISNFNLFFGKPPLQLLHWLLEAWRAGR